MPKGIKGFQKGEGNPVFGRRPHNFGKHPSEETRRRLSESHKGYRMSASQKEKISNSNKGKKKSEETRRKIRENHSRYWLGKKQPKEMVEKRILKGESHYNWQGGISFEPYGLEFNKDLKEVIRNRDRRKCQICEKTELESNRKLDVHHIDYNKKNNDPKNLISLCQKCHIKTNFNRGYWFNYFSNKIYEK